MAASRPPSTPMSKIERAPTLTPGGTSKSKEEKIFVTVRVRPLSKKELSMKDQVVWEFADSQTILYKGPPQDRAAPTSYTFDKVFGQSCQTDLVYEDGAKDVAMSALTGINATIFAYGQTSSGKTFTMRGVTESALSDIYRHIENTPEREFTIKISAMEIYNEDVKDLLKPGSGSLRLLDDPEKGPIVDKLDEQVAKDKEHLRHLISICEEQRQVGETALNDASSRSHQIIKLTVESRLREVSGCVKSFVASLNFVDLAGSERAAQTQAIGARLKEGSHINRSLLTLTKVIRKLSSEKRSGHIPYRDSKLTHILQLSLGGNARAAIICTMSPALTYVEQSRNTLFFATCAKEVTNTAKVNMVISDKQLVKQLQMEVARLQAGQRTGDHASPSEILIMEKDKLPQIHENAAMIGSFLPLPTTTTSGRSLTPRAATTTTTLPFPTTPLRLRRCQTCISVSSSSEGVGSTNGSLPGLPPVGEEEEEEDDESCPVECVTEFKTDEELARFLERSRATGALVVVDFFRPSCGSCKYIEQGFMKLCKGSGDHGSPVIFLKHNVIDEYDEQSEVADRLRIKVVPLFHFYKAGVLVESFATRDKDRITAAIAKYTSPEQEPEK